jgi:hypothetical protein
VSWCAEHAQTNQRRDKTLHFDLLRQHVLNCVPVPVSAAASV